jgi:hypothetical protein
MPMMAMEGLVGSEAVGGFVPMVARATANYGNKRGANSTRPVRGTAKRLSRKRAKPRPMGACLNEFLKGLENSRFSDGP